MQAKSDEKDEEHVARVNRLINDPHGAIAESNVDGGDDSGVGHTRMPGIDVDFANDGNPADMLQLLSGSSGK